MTEREFWQEAFLRTISIGDVPSIATNVADESVRKLRTRTNGVLIRTVSLPEDEDFAEQQETVKVDELSDSDTDAEDGC